MKQLVLCERPFMLYKAILIAMNHKEDVIDIVLSNHMPGLEKMYDPLLESKIFHQVFYFDDVLYQNYIKNESIIDYVRFPKILWTWPKKLGRYLKYQKDACNLKLPEGLDLRGYDEILANDGVSAMNFMLFRNKIPYVVSEHGRGNFRNKVPLHILAVYLSMILDKLNIIAAYSGMSKYVTELEVDRKEDLVCYTKHKKIRECRINDLEQALSSDEAERIYQLYAAAYDLPVVYTEEMDLLLTGPLAHDRVVESEEDQINCYKDAIAWKSAAGRKLMIKPHPRDPMDYRTVFPDALIVDPIVSSEVLSLSNTLCIDKVITVYSTSVSSFQKVHEIVVLGGQFLDRYHRTSRYVANAITVKEDLH